MPFLLIILLLVMPMPEARSMPMVCATPGDVRLTEETATLATELGDCSVETWGKAHSRRWISLKRVGITAGRYSKVTCAHHRQVQPVHRVSFNDVYWKITAELNPFLSSRCDSTNSRLPSVSGCVRHRRLCLQRVHLPQPPRSLHFWRLWFWVSGI